MNSKHTPDPWNHDEAMSPFYNDAEGNSRGGDPLGYAEVFAQDGDVMICGCSLENAPLIAAAPEMLKALTDIRATLLKQADSRYVPTLGDLAGMLDKADAALAPFKGEPAPTTERAGP